MTLEEPDEWVGLEEVIEQTGATPELIRALEDYGIVQPEQRNGSRQFDETDVEIVRAATELSRFGVGGRNLRVFRTSADREAALKQGGPALARATGRWLRTLRSGR